MKYLASISGGKDSLYMLYEVIFKNPDKYPLDCVVHFDLEIDYPFVKDIMQQVKKDCEERNIEFLSLKPSKTWEELYYQKVKKTGVIQGFPTMKARWCNSNYKLEPLKRLKELYKDDEKLFYIGYCVDEEKRYSGKRKDKQERYPLVEEKIEEATVLKWAKEQEIFNNYYKVQTRLGCMYCPINSLLNLAYLYKYYPNNFNYMIDKMKETERIRSEQLGRPFTIRSANPKYNAEYTENIVKTKWLKILEEKEKEVN